MTPSAESFREQLARKFASATAAQQTYVDVRSRELHEDVGGYPARTGSSHQMRNCCRVMYAEMNEHDVVLRKPPSGEGANVVIRYKLPR